MAVVISVPKISCSRPATALPSSMRASMGSASCWSEALGLDLVGLVAEADERLRDGLHEWCRTADVDVWAVAGARADLGQHLGVDPACVTRPAGRLRTGECVSDR